MTKHPLKDITFVHCTEKPHVFPSETSFRKLGLGKVRTRTAIKDATDASLRASFWIWLLRDRQKWDLSTGFKNVSSNNMEGNIKQGFRSNSGV